MWCPRAASVRTTDSKMRTYQKLRIDSRIRRRSGLPITAKPDRDVITHVAKQPESPPGRDQDPVHAATYGASEHCRHASHHPQHASSRAEQNHAHDAARGATETAPRFGKAFTREQT